MPLIILKDNIMALNLGKAFKEHGIAVSEQKTKLWSKPEIIVEELTSEDFELYINDEHDVLSAFVRVETDEGSRLIGFAPGELDAEKYTYDSETGKVKSKDYKDLTLSLGIVTAVRDDDDLQVRDLNNDLVDVEEGIQTLKAYKA